MPRSRNLVSRRPPTPEIAVAYAPGRNGTGEVHEVSPLGDPAPMIEWLPQPIGTFLTYLRLGRIRSSYASIFGLPASSTRRHIAQASRTCSTVRGLSIRSAGLQTRMARPCAREIATLRRFRLKRNSAPRGTSSGLEVAIE